MPDSLQSQLDTITANTRQLVQPERLAITDTAVQDLLSSGIESRTLAVGQQAPSFALPLAAATTLGPQSATSGRIIRSDDLLALGPVILKFFRGRWCPYDMTELEAWQKLYPEVRSKGALIVGISPQLPRQNDFTVQHHRLTFPVLTDAAATLANTFGIAYDVPEPMQQHYRSILINIPFLHGNQAENTWRLPIPATFVLSKTGTVLYAEAFADHRVRPDPADALAVL